MTNWKLVGATNSNNLCFKFKNGWISRINMLKFICICHCGLLGKHGGDRRKALIQCGTTWDWKSSLKGKKDWDYFGHWKRTTEIVFETLPHYCIYRCCQFSVTGQIEEREKFTSKSFPTLPCSGRGTLWAVRNMEEALRNTPGLVHGENRVDLFMRRNVGMQWETRVDCR